MFLIEITFVIKDSIPVLMIVICLTLGKVNLIIIGKTANLLSHLEKNLFLWLYTLEKDMGCKELVIDTPLVMEPVQWPECCIYKKLREVNNDAYTPKLISIGPLHHGECEV